MNGKPHKRFPWLWYLLALFVIVAFAFAPIGSVMLCAAIANAYGCKVDEGSVHPCIINGQDYGELLYSLGVMGWLMLVSIPGGLFAFVGWLIFLTFSIVAAGENGFLPEFLLRFRRRLRQLRSFTESSDCTSPLAVNHFAADDRGFHFHVANGFRFQLKDVVVKLSPCPRACRV